MNLVRTGKQFHRPVIAGLFTLGAFTRIDPTVSLDRQIAPAIGPGLRCERICPILSRLFFRKKDDQRPYLPVNCLFAGVMSANQSTAVSQLVGGLAS